MKASVRECALNEVKTVRQVRAVVKLRGVFGPGEALQTEVDLGLVIAGGDYWYREIALQVAPHLRVLGNLEIPELNSIERMELDDHLQGD